MNCPAYHWKRRSVKGDADANYKSIYSESRSFNNKKEKLLTTGSEKLVAVETPSHCSLATQVYLYLSHYLQGTKIVFIYQFL